MVARSAQHFRIAPEEESDRTAVRALGAGVQNSAVFCARSASAGIVTLAFSLMGIDKRRAKRGAWRIAERTLFLPVVLFGSLGGTLGMFCFHHKTKHWYFRYGFPILLVVQLLLLGAGAYLLLR